MHLTMFPVTSSPLLILLSLAVLVVGLPVFDPSQSVLSSTNSPKDAKVLILGGGVAGITAARTLREHGITEFIIVEARHELGGRMMSRSFGAPDKRYNVEVGANWVQGTQTGRGPENPIWTLSKKHNITTQRSSFFDSLATFDETGPVDFRGSVRKSIRSYDRLTDSAGARIHRALVDGTARGGYSLTDSQPSNRYEAAADIFMFDWEFAQTPEETSWIASSWANNYTFRPDSGGFSDVNAMSVDQRGFKTLIQSEAATFLQPNSTQLRLNATVKAVTYSPNGVLVTLDDGEKLHANYAICTFSLGVLQHNDVHFRPRLPKWKREAIHRVFTKIFLQFPINSGLKTEMGLYADRERGRYAVWQSLDHEKFLPGSGIIFVTVTGDFSKRIEALFR